MSALTLHEKDPQRTAAERLVEHAQGFAAALAEILAAANQPLSRNLRYSEAAERLACADTHVARLARAGHLELVVLGKASPRVTSASVDKLIEQGGIKSIRWSRRRRSSLLAEALPGARR